MFRYATPRSVRTFGSPSFDLERPSRRRRSPSSSPRRRRPCSRAGRGARRSSAPWRRRPRERRASGGRPGRTRATAGRRRFPAGRVSRPARRLRVRREDRPAPAGAGPAEAFCLEVQVRGREAREKPEDEKRRAVRPRREPGRRGERRGRRTSSHGASSPPARAAEGGRLVRSRSSRPFVILNPSPLRAPAEPPTCPPRDPIPGRARSASPPRCPPGVSWAPSSGGRRTSRPVPVRNRSVRA